MKTRVRLDLTKKQMVNLHKHLGRIVRADANKRDDAICPISIVYDLKYERKYPGWSWDRKKQSSMDDPDFIVHCRVSDRMARALGREG